MTTTALDRQQTRHAWVPYVAIAAGACYVAKFVVIILTDGAVDGAPSATAGVLYLSGLALALAAAIGTGLRAPRGRRALVAVGLSISVVAWIMGVGDLLKPVVDSFSDTQYVIDETMILVIGLVLLALGALGKRRETV